MSPQKPEELLSILGHVSISSRTGNNYANFYRLFVLELISLLPLLSLLALLQQLIQLVPLHIFNDTVVFFVLFHIIKQVLRNLLGIAGLRRIKHERLNWNRLRCPLFFSLWLAVHFNILLIKFSLHYFIIQKVNISKVFFQY